MRWPDFLLLIVFLMAGVGLGAWALVPNPAPTSPLGTVAPFTLTEAHGQTVTATDLKGRTWIAGFTFNCCTMSCPQIRGALQQLQEDLHGTRILLVSFSVDPEGDTPASLRELAQSLDSDPSRWLFLTGHGQVNLDELNRFAESSFHVRVQVNPDAAPGERFSHTNRLFLVDRQGEVLGSYACVEERLSADGLPTGLFQVNEGETGRLRKDALRQDGGPLGTWLRLGWLPTLNASLNGLAALLLVVGWVFVRGRWLRAHAACMLTATGVSAIFLASYLYYHFHAGSIKFTATGWVRPTYYVLLLTHVVLAIVIVPLVFGTLVQAWRGRFARHRQIARWTLPLWLYVSVTGVLVYLFLYQWFPPTAFVPG